jgi:hypothetical protein
MGINASINESKTERKFATNSTKAKQPFPVKIQVHGPKPGKWYTDKV